MSEEITYEANECMEGQAAAMPHPCLVAADGSLVLGRSGDLHSGYGENGLMKIGTLAEDIPNWDLSPEAPVQLDAAQPLNITIVGTRGSGKSNTLGVIAEELVTAGTFHSPVIIDTLGAFTAIGRPRQQTAECMETEDPENSPLGFPSVVFSAGLQGAKGYLKPLRISVGQLKGEDLEYVLQAETGQQRALLAIASEAIRKGYTRTDGSRAKPKPDFFNLHDLREWLRDAKPSAEERTIFTASTRQSILRRIAYAQESGLFARNPNEAVSASDICQGGVITVIDLSCPDLHVELKEAVVGWAVRSILRLRLEQVNEGRVNIPGTVIMVDESQLYVPSGGKTLATEELVAFAKCGRKAGCGLVLATQQPAATCSTVLSQADICIAHRLVFEADIRALRKIAPASIPGEMLGEGFEGIRGMRPGQAVIADKLLQERPVLVNIRQRHSEHTGSTLLAPVAQKIAKDAQAVVPPCSTEAQSSSSHEPAAANACALAEERESPTSDVPPAYEQQGARPAVASVKGTNPQTPEREVDMSTKKTSRRKLQVHEYARGLLIWTVIGFLGCMLIRSEALDTVSAFWASMLNNTAVGQQEPQQDTDPPQQEEPDMDPAVSPEEPTTDDDEPEGPAPSPSYSKNADTQHAQAEQENHGGRMSWSQQHDVELQRQMDIANQLLDNTPSTGRH